MAYKIAFFGAKPYDIASFDKVNEKYNYDIRYYKGHLNPNNVVLTQDTDAVCIFVNDTADAAVIDAMVDNGVKLLALRCAGFNNVDLKAAKGKLPVVRVPAYSPYAVAEYSLALMLSLNRKIHRAYWRTRDGNFSRPDGVRYARQDDRYYRHGKDRQDPDPPVERVRNAHSGL